MKPMICIGGIAKEKLPIIRAAGFKYVEVGFAEQAAMSPAQAGDYFTMLRELGLTPCAANGFFGQGLGHFFEETFDLGKTRDYIARAFENNAYAGVKWRSIAFGSGFMRRIPEGYDHDKAFHFMAAFLADEVVPMLEKYDAYLNIEELCARETNFINTCREAAALASAVGSPRVGVLCDYYHMTVSGETPSDVPDFGKSIGHVHVASPSHNREIPFENDKDHDGRTAFFRALSEIPYRGEFVSIEGSVPDGMPFEQAMRDTYACLSKALAPYEA